MKRIVFVWFFIFAAVLPIFAGHRNKAGLSDGLWKEVAAVSLRQAESASNLPDAYRVFSLDAKSLKSLLRQAPAEFTAAAANNPLIMTLPMPDGSLARFRVEQSLVVEPELAAKYPELSQTYRGQGIDDPTATVRFDFLPSGFHSMILSATGTVMVDPNPAAKDSNYISYFKRDAHPTENFSCHLGENDDFTAALYSQASAAADADEFLPDVSIPNTPNVVSGTTLRTYRLALAASNEYAAAVGGNTVAGTLAAQVLIMNRVNGVYERDVAIHMNIVGNNNLIVYAGDNNSCGGAACTAANDPYTNNDGSTMLTENRNNLNTVIGTANFDIGHVFSTGGGGIASLGVPCGASKAQGVTGLTNPVGDAFAIDYVAHEMGHQWGANHTFNGAVSNCSGGNRSNTNAYEPGSGISIMAYAGICGNQDLALHSIDTFHVRSLEVITTYSQTGAGNTCAVQTATNNIAPSVAAVGGTTFNIPKQTPFTLTASATDPNGDAVTYDWEEYDRAGSTTAVPNTDSDNVARAIFRPYSPTTDGSRTFPSLQYILNNANVPPATFNCGRATDCLTGELLPSIARTMVFQVVARDNRANGGGINTATVNVIVSAASGPFAVTTPNTNVSWGAGTTQTVNWSVAATTAAPVNAANVNILLSTDGGQTFPYTLAANTPNDGTQDILIPLAAAPTTTNTARIRVEAAGNIFFDISDTNFTIPGSTAASASISGRVLTANGSGIARAVISMINQQGKTVSVTTNPFGYYRFDNVAAGANYIFRVSDKRYKFNSSVLSLTENIAGYNFTALK